ncbi:hypothetical protein L1049_025042 [Liquidambar formosana]|uniref:Uncharacterized protein n=1 Tax=Liquidambar formosana TaxID=63359 RepID=A0AAP0S1L3_LIQFO
MAETSSLAKPGCQDKCGSIIVPYPFGINDVNCAMDSKFLLTCHNGSLSSPRLMLNGIHLLNIDFEQGTAIGHTPIASTCNISTGVNNFDLTGTPFLFSHTQNMLTAIGCDSTAYIEEAQTRIARACTNLCEHRVNLSAQHVCSGVGCSQTQIPRSFKTFNIGVAFLGDHPNSKHFSPCSYAFLADRTWKYFLNTNDLKDITNVRTYSQVVLDWVVSDQTCESAQQQTNANDSSSNARCGTFGYNTQCTNGSTVGYRCICKPGYKGSPYLPDGCIDIDECSDPKKYRCHGTCKNTPGNYNCSCPFGMHGDGKVHCHGIHLFTLMAGAIGSILFLWVLASLYWLYEGQKRRKINKRKKKFFKRNGGFLLEQQISSNKSNIERTKIFTADELEKATDHYNENRILGQGGQGTVYKGMLPDGRIIAVKKSTIIDKGQIEQFSNEVAILSQINHRHIVKLLGCCLETEVPLLVYEFVSHGTLSNHIHDQIEDFPLTWADRLRIATEVAGALAYMHFSASIPIFHRDIKSTNILLDYKYEAKVSDFGISRSVPTEKTHLTTLVQGTLGYLDPEYFRSNQFTEKSDVYSFGVVLVELLTGRKPVSSTRIEDERGLAAHFISAIKEDCLFDVLDAQVAAEGEKEELLAVAELAKRCLKLNGKKRPTMKEVALELESLRKHRENLVGSKNNQAVDCFISIPSHSEAWEASSTLTGYSSSDY